MALLIVGRDMPVQPLVHIAEQGDDQQREADEIERYNRVWYERIEGFVSEIACVVQSVALLPPCRKTGKEYQRCGVE